MATGSLMMGTLKGKLGETVAMRRNGKQVVRAYISNPKNPNSQKQQVQRMVQATAAQAYSAMKKICDHSFEGVQVGQKSMSYFMSKNMDYLRASIEAATDGTLTGASADFVRKGVNLPVLNNYIVAKGTLPEVKLSDNNLDSYVAKDPHLSLGLRIGEEQLLRDSVSNFVVENNGSVGDWFTFLFLMAEKNNIQNGQQVYRFAFVRFTVTDANLAQGNTYVLEPTLTNYGAPIYVTDNGFIWVESPIEGKTELMLNIAGFFPSVGNSEGQLVPVAYAVIHSRQNVGGSWQRSNAEFVIRNYFTDLDITYPSDFERALATYSGQGEAKGTGDYVLNGGV